MKKSARCKARCPVSAEATQVNTTDATLGNAVGGQAITQLPFEPRNVVGLLAIQPGVVYLGEPTPTGSTHPRSGAVDGGKSDQGNVNLDGGSERPAESNVVYQRVGMTSTRSRISTTTTNAGAE